MGRSTKWNPATTFVMLYACLVVFSGLVLLGVLFVGTDLAFGDSRAVTVPYLITIRGDADPPYWDFHFYGILASLTLVPLFLAGLMTTVVGLFRKGGRG